MASCTCLWQKAIKLFKNQFRVKSVITNANQHSWKQRNCLLEQSGLVVAMYDFIDSHTLICEYVCYKPHMGFWFDSYNLKFKNPICLKMNPEANMFKDAWSYANIIPRWRHTMIFLCQNKDNYPGKGGYIFSCVMLIFIVERWHILSINKSTQTKRRISQRQEFI